jgi:FkbH-like protein
VSQGFLQPLLQLLVGYLDSGDPVLRDLYLAERARYAPHREGREVLARYFSELLPEHEATLLDAAPPSEREALLARLQELHLPLRAAPRKDVLRMALAGDCALSEMQGFLVGRGRDQGLDLDIRYYYFSGLMGTGLAQDAVQEVLAAEKIELVALSFLTYEGLPLYRALLGDAPRLRGSARTKRVRSLIGVMRSYLESLRAVTDAPFLVHNACGLPLGRWRVRAPFLSPLSSSARDLLSELNESIASLVEAFPNCLLMDEVQIARRHGLRDCAQPLLPSSIARDANLHPTQFGVHLADSYLEALEGHLLLRKVKLLLVDFDNTLWDGVMAEGAVTQRLERHRLLKRLRDQGILLAAVSKNTEANIRWDEMALAPDDFVSLKINWDPKVQSIGSIAQELNLGLDSFLLIDDNPAEREMVRKRYPQVPALDPGTEQSWRLLERLFQMPNTRETDEARSRTSMYQEQTQRSQHLQDEVDYTELMKELELAIRFRRAAQRDVARVTELFQRTNQFNTTTIRFSKGEVEQIMGDAGRDVFVAELGDKFGQLGIVASVVVEQTKESLRIVDFVMSCRAMGFGLEHWLLARIVHDLGAERKILGLFRPTDRNQPTASLFPGAGFRRAGDEDWVLEANDERPEAPDWFAVAEG